MFFFTGKVPFFHCDNEMIKPSRWAVLGDRFLLEGHGAPVNGLINQWVTGAKYIPISGVMGPTYITGTGSTLQILVCQKKTPHK